MIKCDHVTCHACPNKEAEDLRAQLAEERDAAEAIRAAIRAAGAQPGESYVDAVRRIAEERDDALLDLKMEKEDCDEFSRRLAASNAHADDLSRTIAAMVEACREVGSEFYGMDDVAAERWNWVTRKEFDELREIRSETSRQLNAALDERDAYKAALDAINAIRNHIIERQSVNWSAHIYPLVKALNDAGITSSPKEEK